MTLRWAWIGCLGASAPRLESVRTKRRPRLQSPSAAVCSGRFPPVTCVANGRTLKQDTTAPPSSVPAAAAKPDPTANALGAEHRRQPDAPEKGYAADAEDAEPLPLEQGRAVRHQQAGRCYGQEVARRNLQGLRRKRDCLHLRRPCPLVHVR